MSWASTAGTLRQTPFEASLCKFRDVPSGSSVWKNPEGQTEVLSSRKTVSEVLPATKMVWARLLSRLSFSNLQFPVACHSAAFWTSDLDENDKLEDFKNACYLAIRRISLQSAIF